MRIVLALLTVALGFGARLDAQGVCSTLRDTVFLQDDSRAERCVDLASIPFEGPFNPITDFSCTDPSVEFSFGPASTTGEPCIFIDPTSTAFEPAEICYTIVKEGGSECHTVTTFVTVTDACDPQIFPETEVVLPPSEGAVAYCLADGADLSGFDVFVNGRAVVPGASADCGRPEEIRSLEVAFYDISETDPVDDEEEVQQTADGAYTLRLWATGTEPDEEYRDVEFASLDDLAAFMTERDEESTWSYDAENRWMVASGTAPSTSVVLNLRWEDGNNGSGANVDAQKGTTTIEVGEGAFVSGAVIQLPAPGLYRVDVIADDGSCSESAQILRQSPTGPNTDTLRRRVQGGATTDTIRLPYDGNDIPEAWTSCGDPAEGTLNRVGDPTAFTYTADTDFEGEDVSCLLLCGGEGADRVCDTTILVVTIDDGAVACRPIFSGADFNATIAECDGVGAVCLPALPASLDDFSFVVDGLERDDLVVCATEEGAGEGEQVSVDLAVGTHAIVVTDLREGANLGCTDELEVVVTCAGGGCGDFTAVDAESTSDDLGTLYLVEGLEQDCEAGRVPFRFRTTETADLSSLIIRLNGVPTDDVETEQDAGTVTVFLEDENNTIAVRDPARDCDFTFRVDVECEQCQGPVPVSRIGIPVVCDGGANTYDVCLPVAQADLTTYTVAIDGQPVPQENLGACATGSEWQLDVQILSVAPPLNVDSIRINGELFTGTAAASYLEVAEQLSDLDATGEWRLDERGYVVGGNSASTYGALFVSSADGADSDSVTPTPLATEAGTRIAVPALVAGQTPFRRITFDNGEDCVQEVVVLFDCVAGEPAESAIEVAAGATEEFCLDEVFTAIDGVRRAVSLVNICEGDLGTAAALDFDAPDATCVNVTGVEPGESRACLVLTDNFDLRDTVNLTITVVEDATLPSDLDAINDTLRAIVDGSLEADLTANDIIPGSGFETRLLTPSLPRSASSLGPSGEFRYTPNPGECNFTDTLVYELSLGDVVDQAEILVVVRCGDIEPYTAFSPNNDGINDFLVFAGIEDFPNNTLRIFNRWGNEVLEVDGYQNNWDGTWDGNRLVDGTYFYLLEVEGRETMSGDFTIWR